MVAKVYNEEKFFHEYVGEFYTTSPDIEVGDWFFSVDKKTDNQVTLTILELDSMVVESDVEYFVGQVLFSFTRNADGRNIYHFGDAPAGDVDAQNFASKLNNEVYVYNSGVAGFDDLGGVEKFANLLLVTTRIANQILGQQLGVDSEDKIVLYQTDHLVSVSDGI